MAGSPRTSSASPATCTVTRCPRASAFGARSDDDGLGEAVRVARDQIERLLSGVEAREAEQIFDEALHARGVARDDVHELALLVERRVAVGERFHVAADGGQRRAELVRDVGDEITSDLVCAPQVGDVVQDQHRANRRTWHCLAPHCSCQWCLTPREGPSRPRPGR